MERGGLGNVRYKKPTRGGGGGGEGLKETDVGKKADIRGIFISTQNDSFLILNSFRPFDFFFPRRRPRRSSSTGTRGSGVALAEGRRETERTPSNGC